MTGANRSFSMPFKMFLPQSFFLVSENLRTRPREVKNFNGGKIMMEKSKMSTTEDEKKYDFASSFCFFISRVFSSSLLPKSDNEFKCI